MKIFDPLRMYSSPLRTAVVVPAAASVPAPGSVRAKAPRRRPEVMSGRYLSCCAGVPNLKIGQVASELCADTMTLVVAQARDSSSIMIT
jgi:hypothetical protein